jgi:hypothetical protein
VEYILITNTTVPSPSPASARNSCLYYQPFCFYSLKSKCGDVGFLIRQKTYGSKIWFFPCLVLAVVEKDDADWHGKARTCRGVLAASAAGAGAA